MSPYVDEAIMVLFTLYHLASMRFIFLFFNNNNNNIIIIIIVIIIIIFVHILVPSETTCLYYSHCYHFFLSHLLS